MNLELWHAIAAIAVILNLSITIFIARRDDMDRFQKAAQITIAWLIPILAAIGLWLFHRSNDDNSPGSGPFGGGPRDSIGVQSSGD